MFHCGDLCPTVEILYLYEFVQEQTMMKQMNSDSEKDCTV